MFSVDLINCSDYQRDQLHQLFGSRIYESYKPTMNELINRGEFHLIGDHYQIDEIQQFINDNEISDKFMNYIKIEYPDILPNPDLSTFSDDQLMRYIGKREITIELINKVRKAWLFRDHVLDDPKLLDNEIAEDFISLYSVEEYLPMLIHNNYQSPYLQVLKMIMFYARNEYLDLEVSKRIKKLGVVPKIIPPVINDVRLYVNCDLKDKRIEDPTKLGITVIALQFGQVYKMTPEIKEIADLFFN